MSKDDVLEKAAQSLTQEALSVKHYEGEAPYYVGDDLFLNEHLTQLYAYICHGHRNDASNWFEDKPHQILLRLLYIATRYQQGVTPLTPCAEDTSGEAP